MFNRLLVDQRIVPLGVLPAPVAEHASTGYFPDKSQLEHFAGLLEQLTALKRNLVFTTDPSLHISQDL